MNDDLLRKFGIVRLAQIADYMSFDTYKLGSRLPFEKKPTNKNRAKQKAQRIARKMSRKHKP